MYIYTYIIDIRPSILLKTYIYDILIPLQYFCLENPMDGGAWKAAVHGALRVRHD